MPNSVCIQPCLGLEMNLTTIGRQASYLAHQRLGAERAHLGCAPALYANVHEDVVFLMIDYVIAVESCDKGCANHLVREKGGSVHATVRVDETLKAAGFDLALLPGDHAPLDHPAVVAAAEEIVRVAEALLGSGRE